MCENYQSKTFVFKMTFIVTAVQRVKWELSGPCMIQWDYNLPDI